MDKLYFSAYQLIIENKEPKIEDFEVFIENNQFKPEYNKQNYVVNCTVDKEKKYFWLYAKFGKALPLGEIYDKKDKKVKGNYRGENELELNNQFFVLYSFEEKLLYLSNSNKKSMIELFFKSKLKKTLVIKNIYKTIDEFLKSIENIKSIKMISKNSIFCQETGLFDEANNIFGLGLPNQLEIKASFHHVSKNKDFLKKIKLWNRPGLTEKLVCVGYNDKDIEKIFNTDYLADKIVIKAEKDEHKLWKQKDIKRSLLMKLGID